MRPGPPRRASASRGRWGLAAARGAERSGGAGAAAAQLGAWDVGARRSGSVAASCAGCGARSERVTQDQTEAF